MSTIKLNRIIFEGPIQIGSMTVREYTVIDGMPARYAAHLHGELQCICLRDPAADVSIYIPMRCVRSMEALDKDNAETGPSDYAEPGESLMRQLRIPPESCPPATKENLNEIRKMLTGTPSKEAGPSEDIFEEGPAEVPRRRGRPRTKYMGPPSDKV